MLRNAFNKIGQFGLMCAGALLVSSSVQGQGEFNTEDIFGRSDGPNDGRREMRLTALEDLFDHLIESFAIPTPDWSATLDNSTSPGVDLDFNGFDLTGAGSLSMGGALSGDSLYLGSFGSLDGDFSVSSGLTVDTLVVTDLVSGQTHSIANHTTDSITEGTVNQYFTSERALSAFADTMGYYVSILDSLAALYNYMPGGTTLAPIQIESTSARLHGLLTADTTGLGSLDYKFYLSESADLSMPTILSADTVAGNGFFAQVEELNPGATYYYSARVTHSTGTMLGTTVSFTTHADESTITFAGAEYGVVDLGIAKVLSRNLRSPVFSNGDSIAVPTTTEYAAMMADFATTNALGDADSTALSETVYAVPPHFEVLETSAFVNSLTDNTAEASPATGADFAAYLEERLEVRGLYYSNDATRDPRGLCPTGWRVPTFLEMGFLIGGVEAQYGPEGTALKSSDLWNGQDYVGINVVPTGIAYPDDSASPNYPAYSGNIFLAPEAIAMLHSQSTYLGSDAVNSGFVDSFGVEAGNEYGVTFKFDDGETISVHAVKGAWPGSVRCITSN